MSRNAPRSPAASQLQSAAPQGPVSSPPPAMIQTADSFSSAGGDSAGSPSTTSSHSNSEGSRSSASSQNHYKPRGGAHKAFRKSSNQRPRYWIPSQSKAVVALDCEMVGVGIDGQGSSVARVSLIDWWGNTLLDEYIQQSQAVTDYRTFVSGITPEQLQKATMSLRECRKQILKLLYTRILVGHGLKNDLNALGISHPWWLIRDTAQYKPYMQLRYDGMLWPRKLKDLAREQLQQEIQRYGQAHSPTEDALAALSLYKLVRGPWEHQMRHKAEVKHFKEHLEQMRQQQYIAAAHSYHHQHLATPTAQSPSTAQYASFPYPRYSNYYSVSPFVQ